MSDIFTALVAAVAGLMLAAIASRSMVTSSVSLARRLGVPPFVVGLTVVAVGTDMPEIANSLMASYRGLGDINVGDSYGSVFTQLTLGLGAMLLMRPLALPRRAPLLQLGIAVAALGVGAVLLADGQFGRVDGAILVAGFALAVAVAFSGPSTTTHEDDSTRRPLLLDVLVLFVALAAVIGGAALLVEGVLRSASFLGAPTLVVSFLGAALGTSAPELAVALTAARRGNGDLAAGDLVGASVADSTISIGLGPLLFPTAVTALASREAALIAAASVAVVAIILASRRTGRAAGAMLIGAYVLGAMFALS